MQGIWKEKLFGFNNKGDRRRKQKRKHTIKDKGKALLKNYYYSNHKKIFDSSFKIELEMENIPEKNIYKKSGFVETWKIGIYKDYNSFISIRIAYNFFNNWYDEYTNEHIKTSINGNIKKLSFLYKEEIEYESPVLINKKFNGYGLYDNNEIYIYGKYIPKWKINTFFNKGKARKNAQKIASSKNRQNLFQWIKKEDWDAEINTHALSKSIAWEID